MTAARQGFFWWEIDVTYYLLKAVSWTGAIWDLHPVPARAYQPGPSPLARPPAPSAS
jgi:stearoyl-CoA desaturase (delta-9 desaturase)